jgi:hypothetical protein
MKTNSLIFIVWVSIIQTITMACVQDDEFEIPKPEFEPVNIEGTAITIQALRSALVQEQNNTGNNLLYLEGDTYITGYVISNDEQGNFFEELIIQDSPEHPVAGVKVLIDANPLFITYPFGRKVYVKLAGLTTGFDSGVLALGIQNGNGLGKISESKMYEKVVRDTIMAEMVPYPLNILDFTADKTNLLIQLSDMQFNRHDVLGEIRKTFAGEPDDQFDGERVLESCATGWTTILSTSTFANFKSELLPQERGNLNGILTYNFFGEEFNIAVNSPSFIHFTNTERCDPLEVDCGIMVVPGDRIVFSEFFESQLIGEPISGNGWTNFIESGTETWEAYFDDSSNMSLGISARMGSFNSNDSSSIGWLITPRINFDDQEMESLNFKTSNSFADGSELQILFSSDWNGNINQIDSAIWSLLSAAEVVQDYNFFGDWIFSGNVDLSCVVGHGYIAWKYMGSGLEEYDGTFELDEIEIKSQ